MDGGEPEDDPEWFWLAWDATDHVALLTTTVRTLVPDEVLSDMDEYETAILEIFALPAWTDVHWHPRPMLVLSPTTWGRAAERGLFAYDAPFDAER